MKKEVIKPFNLEAYKKGAKIQTRDGHKVRIVCTNAENPRFPIIALAKLYNEEEVVVHYTLEGKALLVDTIHQNDLVIVEEVEQEFWSDKEKKAADGYFIGYESNIVYSSTTLYNQKRYKYFASKKQAKSALAMARISQIMANDIENFGGIVTDEEWKNLNSTKYVILRVNNKICTTAILHNYHFLAFHTRVQRNLFLEKYYDLVKDYLMID